jgi:hypothetical protein
LILSGRLLMFLKLSFAARNDALALSRCQAIAVQYLRNYGCCEISEAFKL